MNTLSLLAEQKIPPKNKLNIFILLSDGRLDALRFVRENIDKLDEIRSAIAKLEGYVPHEDLLHSPTKMAAGPRTYHNGYLDAFKEALHLIEANTTDKA